MRDYIAAKEQEADFEGVRVEVEGMVKNHNRALRRALK